MSKQKFRFLSSLLLAVNFVVPTEAMRFPTETFPTKTMFPTNLRVHGRKKVSETNLVDLSGRNTWPLEPKKNEPKRSEPMDRRRRSEPMDRSSESIYLPKKNNQFFNNQKNSSNSFLGVNRDQNSTLNYLFSKSNPLREGQKFTLVHHLEVPKEIDYVEIQKNMGAKDIGQQIAYLINTLDLLTRGKNQDEVMDLLNSRGHTRKDENDYTLNFWLFIRGMEDAVFGWESNFEIKAESRAKGKIVLDCELNGEKFKLVGESNDFGESNDSEIWKFRLYGNSAHKRPIELQNKSTVGIIEQEKQLGLLENSPYLIADRQWKLNCVLLTLKVLANNQNVEDIANLIKLSEGEFVLKACNRGRFSGSYAHIDLVFNNKNDFILTLGNANGKYPYQIHGYRNSDKDFWNFEYINRKF